MNESNLANPINSSMKTCFQNPLTFYKLSVQIKTVHIITALFTQFLTAANTIIYTGILSKPGGKGYTVYFDRQFQCKFQIHILI